ncbi:SDR family NAD(P)-dependent oxidoreductase [Dyadobacter crusticola]|uniref:SDR family NAD(P)-dependent oxidoreductase n=1 Tax=Dyadobacter crusticola TaxID=292407 RepID=UPI0035B625DB
MQISSIGGRVGGAGLTMYQAAKFGLAGFSEALSKEVAPLNIKVTCIEPGGFRTDWAGASMSYAPEIEDYKQTVGGIQKFLASGAFIPVGDPDKAAKVMVDVANHPEPPLHLVLGSEAVGILQRADATRQAELERWMQVSLSTDHDESENFFESEAGKVYQTMKGI